MEQNRANTGGLLSLHDGVRVEATIGKNGVHGVIYLPCGPSFSHEVEVQGPTQDVIVLSSSVNV